MRLNLPLVLRSWLLLFSSRRLLSSGNSPTISLIGEKAQATFRGRPRGRLGADGSGKGCLRGRPRGRLGSGGLAPAALRGRPGRLGSTQATGAT